MRCSHLGDDVPESEAFPISVRAPGAFFTDLVVRAFLPDPTVGLSVRAVLDEQKAPLSQMLNLKVGDKVLFGKYSGTELKLEGTEYIMMREEDILGIIQ